MDAATHLPLHRIQLTLDKADIDEHILDLARTEDATFLVDATHFPKDTDLLTESTTDYFGDYLVFLAYQRHLTWLKVGDGDNGRGTFALWPEADLKALAQATLDAPVPWIDKNLSALEWQPIKRYAGDIAGPNGEGLPQYRDSYPQATLAGIHGDLSGVAEKRSTELGPLLMPYLQQTYGWDGTANGLEKRIPVIDLPPALRDNILARLQGQMFNPRKIAGAKLWFDQQKFEQLAHLSVAKSSVYSAQPLWLNVDIEAENNISTVLGLRWHPYTPPTPRMPATARRMRLEWGRSVARTESVSAGSKIGKSNVQLSMFPRFFFQGCAEPAIEATALQHKVSFEVKRQLLTKILRDLSQQNGVTLTIAGGAPEGALVTGRIHETALSEAMNAIAELYAARWEKTGGTIYELRPNGRSAVENRLEQLGDFSWYRFFLTRGGKPDHPNLDIPDRVYWEAVITPYIPDSKQLSPRRENNYLGLPLAALPDDVQEQLWEASQEEAALKIVRSFRPATLESLKQAMLVIDAKAPLTPILMGEPEAAPRAEKTALGKVWVESPDYGNLGFDTQSLLDSIKPPADAPPAQ